ncbi:unnamed protein product [Cuscuta epithymum]|uniref:Fungal lipase-type domain-containing protein n=1 Tax=Cuscuta epithymum TaxID=186058 RepID=A0AAV0FAS7_9ASTE|nr:unnamed protein product [Cuscuta epithymum]CAH9132590.1 unnamed protein product [Cuscuta epithymum]
MDSLCLKAGVQGVSSPIAVSAGAARLEFRTARPSQVTASAVGRSLAVDEPSSSPWGFSFRHSLKSLWPKTRYDAVTVDSPILAEEKEDSRVARPSGNWATKILSLGSPPAEEEEAKLGGGFGESDARFQRKIDIADENIGAGVGGADDDCDVCHVDDDDQANIEFDRDSFSKLLRRVSLADARLYSKMAYLGNLAYSVAQIKSENLLRRHKLRFITSSLEKKQLALEAESRTGLVEEDQLKKENEVAKANVAEGGEEMNVKGNGVKPSAVYRAASYLYSHTTGFLPFKSSQSDGDELKRSAVRSDVNMDLMNGEVASFMATTDSVTSVVAAKEEVKQAVADDLNSTHSSPCEWFVCDDDQSGTRFIVIQGSETLESWQANLLFEPAQFEELDVPVHRGIYEAAKGMYEQILPEVRAHIKSRGNHAKFRFTGHSLGGSLSLLLNLMLLIRGEVPPYSLLPIITFGSPSIMCGGDRLLRKLGLPRSHVQSITLHRDIVPRAFSCKYPNHIAEFLKAVNGNFRNHPCLNNQKLLYAPMGELFILQPDEEFSPSHHLLPTGSGLYLLSCAAGGDATSKPEKLIQTAQAVFLNTPHPLEILSDRAAYGTGGTVQRDHDMNSYIQSIRAVIHQELNRIRKSRKEHMKTIRVWWPFVGAGGTNVVRTSSGKIGERRFRFAGMLMRSGRDSFKRFSTLVASQHMHFLVVFLFPACLLVLKVV